MSVQALPVVTNEDCGKKSVVLLHLLLNHPAIKCNRNGFYNNVALLSAAPILRTIKMYL